MILARTALFATLITATSALGQQTDPVLPGPPTKDKITSFSNVPIEELFVPGGFDDNDLSEVVVKGSLPNSCWTVSSAESKYDAESKTYHLYVISFVKENEICLPVTSTFVETVKLGNLKAGAYTLQVKKPSDEFLTKTLNVKPADATTTDNFLYAQVDSIHLLKDKKASLNFEIQGRFPPMEGKCLGLDRVETLFDSDDVLTVLPIMKEVDTNECSPDELNNGRYFAKRLYQDFSSDKDLLIHARSINGHSVNRYVPLH